MTLGKMYLYGITLATWNEVTLWGQQSGVLRNTPKETKVGYQETPKETKKTSGQKANTIFCLFYCETHTVLFKNHKNNLTRGGKLAEKHEKRWDAILKIYYYFFFNVALVII